MHQPREIVNLRIGRDIDWFPSVKGRPKGSLFRASDVSRATRESLFTSLSLICTIPETYTLGYSRSVSKVAVNEGKIT